MHRLIAYSLSARTPPTGIHLSLVDIEFGGSDRDGENREDICNRFTAEQEHIHRFVDFLASFGDTILNY